MENTAPSFVVSVFTNARHIQQNRWFYAVGFGIGVNLYTIAIQDKTIISVCTLFLFGYFNIQTRHEYVKYRSLEMLSISLKISNNKERKKKKTYVPTQIMRLALKFDIVGQCT